jgi:hypothetical protein
MTKETNIMNHRRLNVTLTGTDNPYLQDELPCRGEIEFWEFGLTGTLLSAVFRRLQDDGRLTAPVEIRNPSFEYSPDVDHDIFRARRSARTPAEPATTKVTGHGW